MSFLKSMSKIILRLSVNATRKVAGVAWDNREKLAIGARTGGKVAVTAGKAVAIGISSTGEYLFNHRNEIGAGAAIAGGTVLSASRGAARLCCDAASFTVYSDSRISELRYLLHQQGVRYREAVASRRLHVSTEAESLAVGGSLLTDIIKAGHTPEDVQRAYELAYPHIAESMPFAEEAARLHGQDLVGLINGVKGKLFEMKYVEYLNSGELPDGYTAHLAASSIQPGWDIAVSGPDGHTAEFLQLKAADSVSYVKDALAHHPDIQVVTTDEVYDKLVLHGAAGGVSDSGISNAGLNDHISTAAGDAVLHIHWAPPIIALALHAFSAYRLDADIHGKFQHFGERSGKSWLCYLLGGAVAATTQVGWLGILTGIGTRYLAAKGRARRELCQEMERQVVKNEKMLVYQKI